MPKAHDLARQVTIYRDSLRRAAHRRPTDESVVFGFAYAQAEDYFWQIEDTYILGLGRYSEVYGPQGAQLRPAQSGLRDRAAVAGGLRPARARQCSRCCEAFAGGLNYYLATHPETKPRLITHFEPWHVLAFGRHMMLELCFRYTRLSQQLHAAIERR